MRHTWDFGRTRPADAHRYGVPELPETDQWLIYAGGSYFGSHAVRMALSCPRAMGYSFGERNPPESKRNGAVEVLVDAIPEVMHQGPFTHASTVDLLQSYYMVRGTLIHVALAHAFAHRAWEIDGSVIICGNTFGADFAPKLLSPSDAVEVAAAIIGPTSHTYALPAARRMLPGVLAWVDRLVVTEQPVAIETQIAWHVDAPFVYTARLDLLTSNRASGLIRTRDYKTANQISKASKNRYALSGQMAGQEQMGSTWLGARWGGVVVDLLQDPGEKGEREFAVEEYQVPRHPMGHQMGPVVQDAQGRFVSYLGKPIKDWPGNPFACGGCAFSRKCVGR